MNLEEGITVTIYHDPLTEQKPEGEAKLIAWLGTYTPTSQLWQVKFLDDGFETSREILTS